MDDDILQSLSKPGDVCDVVCDVLGELNISDGKAQKPKYVEEPGVEEPGVEEPGVKEPGAKIHKFMKDNMEQLIEAFNKLQPTTSRYHMYHDHTVKTLFDGVTLAIQRDYPEIDKLTEDSDPLEKVIQIPPGFIPKHPHMIDNIEKDELKKRQKLYADSKVWKKFNNGDMTNASGDHFEARVHNAIDKIYQQKKQTAVVFKGIDLTRLDTSQSQSTSKNREIDFLIVNYTFGYILKVECKTTFDHNNPEWMWEKTNKNTGKKRLGFMPQMKAQKDFVSDWLGKICSQNWSFISVLCTKMTNNYQHDPNCKRNISKYIVTNEKDLENLIVDLHERQQSKVSIEEFKTMAKILLYLSPNSILEFGRTFYEKTNKAMEVQGSEETIKFWCFPTIQQKEMLDNSSHLLFWAPWGAGKTLMMTWKTMELAKIFKKCSWLKGEKILFLIFNNFARKKGLLHLDLQKKFEEFDNVKLLHIKEAYNDDEGTGPFYILEEGRKPLSDVTKDYKYIMIDEFDPTIISQELQREERIDFLESIKEKKLVWLSISGIYYLGSATEIDPYLDCLNAAVVSEKQKFEVAEMNISLRTPSEILENMKEQIRNQQEYVEANEKLILDCKVPISLTTGSILDLTPLYEEGNKTIMQLLLHSRCQHMIKAANSGLVILDDTFFEDVFSFPEGCQCKAKFVQVLLKKVFGKLGKEVLFYFENHLSSVSNDEKEVMDRCRQSFVVTNMILAYGFEANVVMNTSQRVDHRSRSSAHVIDTIDKISGTTLFNWTKETLPLMSAISESENHECYDEDSMPMKPCDDFIDEKLNELGLGSMWNCWKYPDPNNSLGLGQMLMHPIVDAVAEIDCYEKKANSRDKSENLLKAISSHPVGELLKNNLPDEFTEDGSFCDNVLNVWKWDKIENEAEFARNEAEFARNEDLLLLSLSKYLNRRIILHPAIKPMEDWQECKIFGQEFAKNPTYNILAYRCGINSIYISPKPKENCDNIEKKMSEKYGIAFSDILERFCVTEDKLVKYGDEESESETDDGEEEDNGTEVSDTDEVIKLISSNKDEHGEF